MKTEPQTVTQCEFVPFFNRITWHDGVTAEMNGEVEACHERGREMERRWNSHVKLLAELQRLVHDVSVNFPQADPFLLRSSRAAIAKAGATTERFTASGMVTAYTDKDGVQRSFTDSCGPNDEASEEGDEQ